MLTTSRRTPEQLGVQLAAFNCSRLARIHEATSPTQTNRRHCSSAVAFGLQKPYICVSSAYKCGCKPWLSISRSRSAVYRRNRIGPRTDPCDTPHMTYCAWSNLDTDRHCGPITPDRISEFTSSLRRRHTASVALAQCRYRRAAVSFI